MASLDDYSDEELGRLLREAARSKKAAKKADVTTLDAFCSWLNLVNLGWVATLLLTSKWAWERVQRIWRKLF